MAVAGGTAVPLAGASTVPAPPSIAVGTAPSLPAGATPLGPASPAQPISFDVVLAPRDPAALESLALAVSTPGSPERGDFLTPAQFASEFGQPATVTAAAENSLTQLGLSPGPVSANGLVIPVTSTIGQVSAALGTGFSAFRSASGAVSFANTSAPKIPAPLAAITTAIVGLDDAPAPVISPVPAPSASSGAQPGDTSTPSPVTAATATAATAGPAACAAATTEATKSHGWTYPQLASAYKISSLFSNNIEGAGTNVALFEIDPYFTSTINTFQKCYGTHVTVVKKNVDGGSGLATASPEATLDIETVIALAPKSTVTVYEAPASNYSKHAVDEYTAIFDADTSQVLSISYGACESYTNSTWPGLMASEHVLFEQAATEGISVMAGSGDTGSEGCERQNRTSGLATLDPTSQPFVTSVGGTDLTGVGSPPAETAWNDGTGATGGGVSSQWPMPAWQSAPGVPSADSSGTPCGAATGDCREVPDVAASASGDNPYVVYYGTHWAAYAGTSASSPLWAAMTADIESQGSTFRAGFLNPSLYAFDIKGGAFNDITTGNNDWTGSHGGLYPTTSGYDIATGLGSPIANVLAADFAANP